MDIKDELGNRLVLVNKTYYLELAQEGKKRKIATFSDDTVYTTKKKNVHFFRRMNGYGFNDALLNHIPNNFNLSIKDEDGVYVIPMDKVKENLEYDSMVAEGFEKQGYLDINFIKDYLKS